MILTTKEIKSLIQEELNKFLNESSSLDQELKKEIISIFGEKALEVDKFFLTIGFRRTAQSVWDNPDAFDDVTRERL